MEYLYKHECQTRVRYGETDQMGIVYYGNYAEYYEIGRVETLRSLGIRYRDIEEVHRIVMPVVHMEVRYLRPARYDELLTINTYVLKLDEKYIYFYSELFNEEHQFLNMSRIKLCFVDHGTLKRVSAPELLINKLNTLV